MHCSWWVVEKKHSVVPCPSGYCLDDRGTCHDRFIAPPPHAEEAARNKSINCGEGGLTGPGLARWHPGLYLKKDTHTLTLTLTLFPSLNNISNSWDCCHVFGLRCCSPGATCTDQRGWAIRHTGVQLLDFHIATTLRRITNRLGSRSSSFIGLIHSVLQLKTNHAGVIL